MRWDNSRHGGFTSGEPWLPMGPDVIDRNVERLKRDERSLLSLYRALIALRRRKSVLTEGGYEPGRSRNDILTFRRVGADVAVLVALNLVHEPRRLEWTGAGTILLSTYLDGEEKPVQGPLLLRPDEGLIVEVKGSPCQTPDGRVD